MTDKQRISLLAKQKEALTAYLRMCIFMKEVPRESNMELLEETESIEALDGCIKVFADTKIKYTELMKDL